MSKTPNTGMVHPGVKVHAPLKRNEAATTHGGEGNQRSESHYRKIVDSAVNKDADRQGRR